MTVLMRDEVNDADLAWAAADPSMAPAVGQLLRARQSLGAAEIAPRARRHGDGGPVLPSFLRERGAL